MADEFRAVGHVDDGGWLGTAPAAVNDQIDAVFEAVADFVRIGQRLVVFRQHQGATEQRLAQFLQQAQGDVVVGNAQAYGFAFRVQRAVGDFFGGLQDEGVAAGSGGFELAEFGRCRLWRKCPIRSNRRT